MEKTTSGDGDPHSLVKINSISVDLGEGANEKGKCQHFSIRGYVADIRKKDWKKCWPFPIDCEDDKSEEKLSMLSPLKVTKFRWWRCPNCLREIDTEGSGKQIGIVSNCCDAGIITSSTCSQMSPHVDVVMAPSDFQQASEKNIDGRKSDASTSTNVNGDDYSPPSCNSMKENKDEAASTIIIDHENASGNSDTNLDVPRLSGGVTESMSFQVRERNADDTVLKSKCIGFTESCKPDIRNHDISDNTLAVGNLECMENSSVNIALTEKVPSGDDQHKEIVTACRTSPVADEVNGTSFAAKGLTNEHSSQELDPHNYASFAGDKTVAGNNLQVQHHAAAATKGHTSEHSSEELGPHDYASSERDKIVAGMNLQDWHHNDNAAKDHTGEHSSLELGPRDNASPEGGKTVSGNNIQNRHHDDDVKDGEHSSPELGPQNLGSSEGDGIVAGDNVQDQHRENMDSSHDGKIQKVRLLTDLLGANRNAKVGHTRKKNASSNASAGVDSLSVPLVQLAALGNIKKGFRGQNRKRKMPDDKDWSHQEMNCDNNLNKEVRIVEGCAEATVITISSSESEEDASAGIGSEVGTKKHWTKRQILENPIESKKNVTRTLVDEGCSSLVPPHEGMHKETQNNKDQGKGSTADYSSVHDSFTGRAMDPLLKNLLPAQRNKRKSQLCKEKNKKPQVENTTASIMPSLRESFVMPSLRESQSTRQNLQIMRTGPENVPFQSMQDAATGKGSFPFLESYLAAQRNNRKYIPQTEDGLRSLLRWQDGIFRSDHFMRKDEGIQHVGSSSVPIESSTDAFNEKGIRRHISSRRPTQTTSLMNKKQNCTSLVEDRDSSLTWKKDFSGTRTSKKTVGEDQEQGALDDIPMEIVELMAKNQYERRLPDAGHNHPPSETTYAPRGGEALDFTKVYGAGLLRLWQEKNPNLLKPQSSNTGKNIFTTTESARALKPKPYTYFPPMGQSEGAHQGSRGFGALSGSQEKQLGGLQVSSASVAAGDGSSRHNGSQSCKWHGDLLGHRSSHTSLYHSAPTSSGMADGVWSSVIPKHIPYGLNSPENFAARSVATDMASPSLCLLHKGKMNLDHNLNFKNQNAADLEKQKRNLSTETFKAQADCPCGCNQKGNNRKLMGSGDAYRNETIPAMHLLSLMDARKQSSTPFNVDGNTKFVKKPFAQNHQSKELSEIDFGLCKTAHTSKQSSDCYRKKHLLEGCGCSAPVAMVGPSGSKTQNDKTFRTPTALTGQSLYKSGDKGKEKCSYSPTKNRFPKLRKPVSTSETNLGPTNVDDSLKGLVAASDSAGCPLHGGKIGELMKQIEMEARSSSGTVLPVVETGTCSINRNPAEFSLPVEGNVYTIGSEDLKFRKRYLSDGKSGLFILDGHKRQRIRKLTSVKERTAK